MAVSASHLDLVVLRSFENASESGKDQASVAIGFEAIGPFAPLESQQRQRQPDNPAQQDEIELPTIRSQTSHVLSAHSEDRAGSMVNQDANGRASETPETDGGVRAWTVVAASTWFFLVTLGLVYSFGILQSELIGRGLASASTLGWVSSASILPCVLFATPFASLVNRFGSMRIAFLSAILTGGGYLLTSFSLKSVPFLFVSQTIFGCGYACQFWSCGSISAAYFTRRRGLATGIVFAGSGVGGAVFSVALAALIKRFGVEWAVRTYGLLALITLIPTSFAIRERTRSKVQTWRLSLFRNPRFALLFIATAIATFTLYVPSFLLPTYASSAGYSATTGAWLTAGYNLASAVGRILFGLLADTRVGPVTTLTLATTIMSLSILCIWIVSSSIPSLIIFLLANGSAGGALFSLQPTVNASLFGLDDIALTMAMLSISRIVGTALGAPIAGYLLDASGGPRSGVEAYRPALLLFGFLTLISAATAFAVRWQVAGWDLKKRV